MTVLAFLNQKGGTGKTTLSLNVAYGLAQTDQRVLLIDADQQASANVWSSLREDQPFSVFAAPRKNLHKEVDRQREHYDWIVIDGTPRDDAITRSCLIAADLVIIDAADPLEALTRRADRSCVIKRGTVVAETETRRRTAWS